MQCGSGAEYGAGVFCWHAVQEHSVAALCACHWSAAGICDYPILPAWCRCMRKTRRILSMKAAQDPSICCLAMDPDAIRTKPVLARCGPLPLFQCSRSGRLLRIFKAATDPSEAEETWSRPMPSKRMPAFIALTGPLENSQKSQLKFRTFGIPQKSQLKNRYFGFSQKSHFKFWRSKIPQKSQMKI